MTVREKRSTSPMVMRKKSAVASNNMHRILQLSTGFLLMVAVFYTGLSMFQL